MDKTILEDAAKLFASPYWYASVFIFPVISNWTTGLVANRIKKRLEAYAQSKSGGTSTSSNTPADPAITEWNNREEDMSSMLRPLTIVFRPIYLLFNVVLLILFILGVINNSFLSPTAYVVFWLYIILFAASCMHHFFMARREIWQTHEQSTTLQKWLRAIVIPVTYMHVVVILYMFAVEHMFSIFIYFQMREGGAIGPIALLFFFSLGIILVKDLLDTKNKASSFFAFLMAGMTITFLLMIISLIYKTA